MLTKLYCELVYSKNHIYATNNIYLIKIHTAYITINIWKYRQFKLSHGEFWAIIFPYHVVVKIKILLYYVRNLSRFTRIHIARLNLNLVFYYPNLFLGGSAPCAFSYTFMCTENAFSILTFICNKKKNYKSPLRLKYVYLTYTTHSHA